MAMIGPGDLITASALFVGFGVTVLMFRIQRELDVLDKFPRDRLWLAWADYLVLAAIALSLIVVVIPLVSATKAGGGRWMDIGRAACATTAVLLAGFVPAILAHYRIELGASRHGKRDKGEPLERIFVVGTAVVATAIFVVVFLFSH